MITIIIVNGCFVMSKTHAACKNDDSMKIEEAAIMIWEQEKRKKGGSALGTEFTIYDGCES